MNWLPPSEYARLRAAALALTAEERSSLTWEAAAKLVPADTVALAGFAGVRCVPGSTPWSAVCYALRIEGEDHDDWR